MPRPTTGQRGYDYRHQLERERLRPEVDAGMHDCQAKICIEPSRWIEPGTPWDLGHNDDRSGWTGPEHMSCNRSAGGRNGALVSNARRGGKRTSREW